MGEPQYHKYPSLQLSQHIFHVTNPSAPKSVRQSSLESVQDAIKTHTMAPLYRHLAHPVDGILNQSGEGTTQQPPALRRGSSSVGSLLATKKLVPEVDLPWDESLYEQLRAENEKELEAIDREEAEANEKAGETEVQDAVGKKAELFNRICDKVRSVFLCSHKLALIINLTGQSDYDL